MQALSRTEKGMETNSLLEFPEETQSCQHSDLRASDLQNSKAIKLYCFKLLILRPSVTTDMGNIHIPQTLPIYLLPLPS